MRFDYWLLELNGYLLNHGYVSFNRIFSIQCHFVEWNLTSHSLHWVLPLCLQVHPGLLYGEQILMDCIGVC